MILVTGGDGFVGTALVSELKRRGLAYRAVARKGREGYVGIGDINSRTDWRAALDSVDVVVHLASRAHVRNDSSISGNIQFQASVDGPLNLARQAVQTGVKRFDGVTPKLPLSFAKLLSLRLLIRAPVLHYSHCSELKRQSNAYEPGFAVLQR